MKKIIVAIASFFFICAPVLAQWQVPDHSMPVGRGAGTGFKSVGPCALGTVLGGNGSSADPSCQTMGGAYPTVGGTASAITITTGFSYSSLSDGQEFIFTPLSTVISVLPTLEVDSAPAKSIKSVDGYSFATSYDIQAGKPLRVRYLASLDVFSIVSPPTQFEDTPFGHGRVKLQASSSTAISMSQDDGQGLLMWNSATSAFRMVRTNSITVSALFAGNSTIVNGVAGQNLSANKLYAVYVNNTTPTNQNANNLEFWQTYSGVGVAAWNPTINEIGIYVKPTVSGGIIPDNTRTYVGIIWTGTSDISNAIAPAAVMFNHVYSHFTLNRWKFGYQTTVVTNSTSSAVLAAQTTPSIGATTEGISDSPRFDAKAVATCDTAGAIASFRISISGTAYDGSVFTQTSPTYTATAPAASLPVYLAASWESAPPMGFYTAKTDIAASVGTCSFATDILGHLGQ